MSSFCRGCAAGAILLLLWLLSPAELRPDKVWIQNDSCAAGIVPSTLEMAFGGLGRPQILVSVAQTNLGRVANANWGGGVNPDKASRSLPNRKVSLTFAVGGSRLVVNVRAAEPGGFPFPNTPAGAAAKGWILPQWLTTDRRVQRTTFGEGIEILANFGPEAFHCGDTIVRQGSIVVKRQDARLQAYVAQSTVQL